MVLHLQGWECLWSGYISYNMLQLRGHLCVMPWNPLDKRSIWEGGLWVIMHSWPLSSGDFKSGNLGTSFPCRWRWSVHPWTFSAIWTTLMISKRKLLWRKSSVLSPSDFFRKKNLRKIFSIGALRTWVDSLVLLLIIEVKINFSLGFDNTDYQTNKLQNVHALHCTIVLYIVP